MTDPEVLRSVAKQVSDLESDLLANSVDWTNRMFDDRLTEIRQHLDDAAGDLRILADELER